MSDSVVFNLFFILTAIWAPVYASKRGRSWIFYFFLGGLITPFGTLLLLAVLGPKPSLLTAEKELKKARARVEKTIAKGGKEKKLEKAKARVDNAIARVKKEKERAQAKAEAEKEQAKAEAEREQAKAEAEREQAKAEAEREQAKAEAEKEQAKAEAKAEREKPKSVKKEGFFGNATKAYAAATVLNAIRPPTVIPLDGGQVHSVIPKGMYEYEVQFSVPGNTMIHKHRFKRGTTGFSQSGRFRIDWP